MIQRHLELGLSHIYSIRAKRRSDLLLEVARKLLDTSGEIDDLLKRIVAQTRELTGADRCSFFLVDKERNELYAKIFDLNAEPQPTTDQAALPASLNPQPSTEIRFPINRGIAAHVYQTGELLNLENAYKNEMFNSDIDGVTGFVTTSLLTIPVFNNGEVIGVIQAMNKAPRFTKADEADGVAFAVLAGLALHQSLMMEERVKAEHHAKVALEILAYHRQINPEQLSALTSEPTIDVHAKFPGFATLSFQGRLAVPLDQTIRCCVFMLEDLEILQRWRTPRETAIKFLLTLQLGYRDVPYHNWMHAFSVAQFCYVLARKAGLLEAVGLDEVAALFISCLGHDVDHRGTTNNFQKLAGSSLATLYSSMGSVLERHHLAQTLYILQVDGCNLLANVESSEYRKVLDRIRRNILATDLASHFAIQKRTEAMLVQRETTAPDQLTPTEKSNATHLICCLIMTACDLSDAGKPWESASLVAELIYAEFFAQGDLERARGEKPMEINDRTTANKPKLQLGFIDHVAMPAFKFLSRALPLASEVEGAVLRNRQRWQALLDGSST
ncbi:phosphodiesterase 2A, variant [Capsaspora owczarzaki ATCC 30864]|nr:phosphodiesterase 2A, variant [Capsaspora owczarzaki ATCC 30864]